MVTILCSACLLGVNCKYNGKASPNERVLQLGKKYNLIPVCPEQLGGLPTPRVPQEIQGMDGDAVLDGKCKVVNKEGKDVTENFIRGAHETLKIAKLFNAKLFIGKQRSPSCACGETYDGSFTGRTVKGDGVTTALLKRNGIKCMSQEEL
ncbi:DUF523 domain-containing protein [Candidatus Micrarchaeota archaeon]|nr:MAG: DUF523 domain-containing protein [Candidatus Micrarchaeota archaeon]